MLEEEPSPDVTKSLRENWVKGAMTGYRSIQTKSDMDGLE